MTESVIPTEVGPRRALWRDEARQFGGQLEWLADPSKVPEEATHFDEENLGSPYLCLAGWMLERIVEWSDNAHGQINLSEKIGRDLTEDEEIAFRERMQDGVVDAFWPGLHAAAEIFGTIPYIASREGVDRQRWAEVASKSRDLGKAMAMNGTVVQACVRKYLYNEQLDSSPSWRVLDPRKLILDTDGAVTTVTPIDEVVATARRVAEETHPEYNHDLVCVVLQASPYESKRTVFDTVWDAFAYAAEHYIYPTQQVESDIPLPSEPDQQMLNKFHEIATAKSSWEAGERT